MMVGHAVTLNIARPDPVDPKPRIEVKNLTVRSIDGIVKLDDVSFTANSGEILGIAGISGCGQKELLEAIAGLQPTENGSICYVEDDGTREELLGKDPLSIAEMGVALSFVPEDRLGMGLVLRGLLGRQGCRFGSSRSLGVGRRVARHRFGSHLISRRRRHFRIKPHGFGAFHGDRLSRLLQTHRGRRADTGLLRNHRRLA